MDSHRLATRTKDMMLCPYPSLWVHHIHTNLAIDRKQRLFAHDLTTARERDHQSVNDQGTCIVMSVKDTTYSGKRPRQRATYSLLTGLSRRPPNHAPSFFDASTVSAHTITPEVRRSRRFEAAHKQVLRCGPFARNVRSGSRRTVHQGQVIVVFENLQERVEVVASGRVDLRNERGLRRTSSQKESNHAQAWIRASPPQASRHHSLVTARRR